MAGEYSWLRLGLPIGPCFLITAIFEMLKTFRLDVKDLALLFAHGLASIDPVGAIVASSIVGVRLLLGIALVWISTVHLGHRCSLLVWAVILALWNIIGFGGYLSRGLLVLLDEFSWEDLLGVLYGGGSFLLINSYLIAVAVVVYRLMGSESDNTDTGGGFVDPIGRGVSFLLHYFKRDLKLSARFLLTLELVVDVDVLVEVQGARLFGGVVLGHEYDPHPMIILEEIGLRLVRVAANAMGLWLLREEGDGEESRKGLKAWCGATLLLIFLSVVACIHLMVDWDGGHAGVKTSYMILYLLHLLSRGGVLAIVWRFCRGGGGPPKMLFYNMGPVEEIADEPV